MHKLPHIRYIDLILDICLELIFLYNDFLYFDNEFNGCTFKCLQAKRNWAGLYLLLLSDNVGILALSNQKQYNFVKIVTQLFVNTDESWNNDNWE